MTLRFAIPGHLQKMTSGKTAEQLSDMAAGADEQGCEILASEIDAVVANMERDNLDRLPRVVDQVPATDFQLR